MLAPGAYRLEAVGGDVQGTAPPRLAVICAGRDGPSLAVLDLPDAGASGARLGGSFLVPPGCPAQWLTIIAASSLDDARATPWIDAISVRANRPGRTQQE